MCVKRDILAALSYFDLFDYPITQAEIFIFLRHSCTYQELVTALQELSGSNHVCRFEEFYTLQDNFNLIQRRRAGNLKARKMLASAQKIARILSCFPFVRGVAVSGSLSKNFADEKSDIDFFIITATGRLWLARTFLHVLKKLSYLFHLQHCLCMNYFVDEKGLEIREKNVYTAVEVATLLPFFGLTAFQGFFSNNRWVKDFLPNHGMKISYLEEVRRPWIKRLFEILLHNVAGNFLDNIFMRAATTTRW